MDKAKYKKYKTSCGTYVLSKNRYNLTEKRFFDVVFMMGLGEYDIYYDGESVHLDEDHYPWFTTVPDNFLSTFRINRLLKKKWIVVGGDGCLYPTGIFDFKLADFMGYRRRWDELYHEYDFNRYPPIYKHEERIKDFFGDDDYEHGNGWVRMLEDLYYCLYDIRMGNIRLKRSLENEKIHNKNCPFCGGDLWITIENYCYCMTRDCHYEGTDYENQI